MRYRTADLLLVGGRLWGQLGTPIDDGSSAIAVAGGTVIAIGPRDDLQTLADDATVVVDLDGRRVIPGLVDSHIHAIRAGLTYLDELDWTDIRSIPDALDSVRRAAGERNSGTWITVLGGWHPSQLAENRMPSRRELDHVAPSHPVFVHPLYGHEDIAVLNSAGLAAMGWTSMSADPEGVLLYRDLNGDPDGRLTGLPAYQQIGKMALAPDRLRARESSKAFFQRLSSLGLTGVIDAAGLGMEPSKYRAVRDLARTGELPVRVRMNVCAVTRGEEAAEIRRWREYLDPGLGNDLLSVLGMGEAVHYGCHDWEGMTPLDIGEKDFRELTETLAGIADAGWPLTIHAILDSSVTRILDAVTMVANRIDVRPLRWSLCHVECISRRNLERVKELGLGLTLQSRMVHKSRICAERWGAETLLSAPPLGDVLELGIPFGAGTDATRGSSYNPWQALWWFVTGECVDGGPRRDPRHRLDRATALDAYTRGSTWFSFEEDRRGQLMPGASADLAVLSDDYFAVPDDVIPSITSDLTIVAGRIVHSSGALT